MKKIIWKVGPKPTGKYRSFQTRGWPTAEIGNEIVAALYCDEPYTGFNSRRTDLLITVRVTDRFGPDTWEWKQLKLRAKSVAEAKQLVATFYKVKLEWLPKEI